MRIKIGSTTINMDVVVSYNYWKAPEDSEIRFWFENISMDVRTCLKAKNVCEYLDMLYLSGKDKEINFLLIDRKFEEGIADVEFKTLEEFKNK